LLSLLSSGVDFYLKLKHQPSIEMEQAISRLEYSLKDQDVEADPVLTTLIKQVVDSLRAKMVIKKIRWAEQERELGDCPCGDVGCIGKGV